MVMEEDGSVGLAAVDVAPDGWVVCSDGLGNRSTLDLSAVRFCIGRGLALVDGVRLHACDAAGGRYVVLQGALAPRAFPPDSALLASVPMSCQPSSALPFAVAGAAASRFHLVWVRPGVADRAGGGIDWGDSKWQGVDELSLSGVMFTASQAAQQLSRCVEPWTANRRVIAIGDFQRSLISRYGSLVDAWRKAYDGERTGVVDFARFGAGCATAGYRGDIARLWAMLDVDGSGEISLDEVGVDLGKLEVKCLVHT